MKGKRMQCALEDTGASFPQLLSFDSINNDSSPELCEDRFMISSSVIPFSNSSFKSKKPCFSPIQTSISFHGQGVAWNTPIQSQQSPYLRTTNSAACPESIPFSVFQGMNKAVVSVSSPTPPKTYMVGTTDLRSNGYMPGRAAAQLTIFYAGTVYVYDDVSPEKAQAIMMMAEEGSSAIHHHATKLANQTQPPYSISRYYSAISPTVENSSGTVRVVKPVITSSIATPTPLTHDSAGAVPQARKASLVRFLEKRKEKPATD